MAATKKNTSGKKTVKTKAEEPFAEIVDSVLPVPEETPAEIKIEAKKKILFVASEAAPYIATGGSRRLSFQGARSERTF